MWNLLDVWFRPSSEFGRLFVDSFFLENTLARDGRSLGFSRPPDRYCVSFLRSSESSLVCHLSTDHP